MIKRMLVGGIFAGFAAGLLGTLLHFALVQELILLGEQYETGEIVHFLDAETAVMPDGGDHGHGDTHGAEGDAHGGHGADDGGETSPLMRNILTVLFTALIYVGYGLFMTVGFQIAEMFGRPIEARQGILWGIAGFVAFQLAPGIGLPPELPGTFAEALHLRQQWWFGTVAATIGGLALLGYGRNIATVGLAVILLAAPHIIGAPRLDEFWGMAPPELGAEFATRVLAVGLAVWAFLGWFAARLWTREAA